MRPFDNVLDRRLYLLSRWLSLPKRTRHACVFYQNSVSEIFFFFLKARKRNRLCYDAKSVTRLSCFVLVQMFFKTAKYETLLTYLKDNRASNISNRRELFFKHKARKRKIHFICVFMEILNPKTLYKWYESYESNRHCKIARFFCAVTVSVRINCQKAWKLHCTYKSQPLKMNGKYITL